MSKKEKSASAGAKGETKQEKKDVGSPSSENLSNAGNSRRSKKDKKARKEQTQKLASILNPKEAKELESHIYNMLECEKPAQLVRPVPVRSVPCHYAGQIRFDSDDEYVEVRTRPDPFQFIEITTQTTASVAAIPAEEIGSIYSGPAGANSTSSRYVCLQEPIVLADGTYVRPVISETNNSGGILEAFFNDTVVNYGVGWHGLGYPTGSIFTINVVNNGSVNCTVAVNLFRVNTATRAQTLIQAGSTVVCSANASAAPTITTAASLTLSADEILVFAISVVSTIAGQFTRFRDLVFQPTVYSGLTATDVYSTQSYTVGQAVYGLNDPRAQTLDDFFRTSLLWAPVGLSSRLNVKQQLNEAGGMMLASYLPSFILEQTSSTPSKAWEDIVAYKRSYPVKDCLPFRTGAHASWVGMRLQDYEFRGQFREVAYSRRDSESLPVNVFISQKASASSTIRYFFDFQVNFEVQSVNPLVTAKLGPASPDFLAQFLAMAALHEMLVGENPSHIERIKKLVKKIANDPRVRSAAKFAIQEGVPFLLRHI